MYKIYLHYNINKPKHVKRENRSNFVTIRNKPSGWGIE